MEPVSTREMRVLEDNSEFLGVSKELLMENAGRSVADEVEGRFGGSRVLIMAGRGNNGGDGFVAARHLAARGFRVHVVLLADPRDIRTREARLNWEVLSRLSSVEKSTVVSMEALEGLRGVFEGSDVVIDAIFGTGLRGEVREPYRTAIRLANEAGGARVAVDVPSGLNPDTGEVHGTVFRADVTVTFHAPKPGLLARPDVVGELVVKPIGIPVEAGLVAGPGDLGYVRKARRSWGKKGDYGRVLVVGGSWEYSGAPALSALAALRTGVDLVFVATPEPAAGIVKSYSPALIVHPLEGRFFEPRHVGEVLALSERADVVVLGPGLGREEGTSEAVVELVRRLDKPVVVDADALRALAGRVGLGRGKAVLTPHGGEFRVLFGEAPGEDPGERGRLVRKWAAEAGVTVLLKGHVDVISDGRRVKWNCTGNPGMTVGGTGDVLAGVVSAFLAWSGDLFYSAAAGAFVNGLAGDIAVGELGFHITPLDVIGKLPLAMERWMDFMPRLSPEPRAPCIPSRIP